MAQTYHVIARIVSIRQGACSVGHQVGDEFLFTEKTPGGLCTWAYNTMYPAVETLMYGGGFPWEDEPGTACVVCPDPEVPVVFELRRVLAKE
jgi:uncharacterized repeat protein (TIGR04076 family)